MKFPNAFEGVKKIFVAEILALIAAICASLTLAFTFLTAVSAVSESVTGTVASLGGILVFGIAAGVLAIIAFIFQIIGVNKAAQDEPSFKIALYLILAGLVISLIGSFINGNTVKSIFTTVGDVVNLAVTVYIIQGIRNLAVKLGNDEMDKKGNTLFKIIIAMYVLIFIAEIIMMITSGNNTSMTIAGILAIIAGILKIVQYVLYLIFLSNAKKMLA